MLIATIVGLGTAWFGIGAKQGAAITATSPKHPNEPGTRLGVAVLLALLALGLAAVRAEGPRIDIA